MRIQFSILMLSLAVACGCTNEKTSSLDGPKEFFAVNKAGTSADYGVIKWQDPSDHVISVHGFADDFKTCAEVADALNFNACKETAGQNCLNPFSCIALNH